MVANCCAVGCKNRGRDNVSFYRFPANQERRAKWLAAVKRKDWEPTGSSRLCSAHFIKGKSDSDPLSPDFVPSLFAHTSPRDRKRRMKAMEHYEKRQKLKKKRREVESKTLAAQALVGLSVSSSEKNSISQSDNSSQHTSGNLINNKQGFDCNMTAVKAENLSTVKDQDTSCLYPLVTLKVETLDAYINKSTKFTMTDLSSEYIKSLELECQSLRSECYALKEDNRRLMLAEHSFENNDVKVKYYTGLPSCQVMMHIFNLVNPYLKKPSSLTKFQEFLLTLMRIRLNLSVFDLGYRFDVSPSTISRLFHHVIDVCSSRLVPALVSWPEEEIRSQVERVIGVAKQKYTMLQATVPNSLLQEDEITGLTTLDKVIRVACALSNLSESVVPSSE